MNDSTYSHCPACGRKGVSFRKTPSGLRALVCRYCHWIRRL